MQNQGVSKYFQGITFTPHPQQVALMITCIIILTDASGPDDS